MTSVYARYPRNGRTAREVAAKVGASIRTAQRWTSEPRETFEARAAQRQDAIRAFKAAHPDASMRAIAAEFKCSVGTVHRALKQAS